MELFEIALFAPVATGVARRLGRDRAFGRQIRERLFGQCGDPVVVEVAGRGQHHPPRAVMVAQIGRDLVAPEPADNFGPAQHRPAHRLVGVGAFLKVIEDDVVGGVVGLADLLQDNGALALHLLGLEGRVLQDVGKDVERERHILLQHLGVEGGALARGVGVEVAAHRLDLLGDGERAAPLGPFERHMLEKVGDTVDFCRLVSGPDIDPDAK